MDILGKIFNSDARVKIMRLFLLSKKEVITQEEAKKRIQVNADTFRKEVKLLAKADFLEKKESYILVPKSPKKVKPKKRGRGRPKKNEEKVELKQVILRPEFKKKKIKGYTLNDKFPLRKQLEALLIGADTLRNEDMVGRFRKAGLMKLIVLSGIFVKDEDRRVDLLLVGEKLSKAKLEKAIQNLESDIGRELRYSVFSPTEFKYRLDMYDNLLLDIFDHRHVKVLDKTNLNF